MKGLYILKFGIKNGSVFGGVFDSYLKAEEAGKKVMQKYNHHNLYTDFYIVYTKLNEIY